MNKESPKLGITTENVDQALATLKTFGQDALSYVLGTFKRMQTDQQIELFSSLEFQSRQLVTNNSFVFRMGAALGYSMIPQHHKEIPLTREDVNVALKSMIEDDITKPDNQMETDLSWFVEKLRADSPPFIDFLDRTLYQTAEAEGNTSDFLFGIASVAMPFYMKAEAQELEQKFFPKEDKNKA